MVSHCKFVTFPIGILGQVWYLIVSIPDLCTLTYFYRGLAGTYADNDIFVPSYRLTKWLWYRGYNQKDMRLSLRMLFLFLFTYI